MLSFPTQYDRQDRFYSNPGTSIAPVYSMETDENGVHDLVQVSTINTYERVQSWKESCDLKTILARFANGDVDVLNKNSPMFGDFTDSPTSLADFYKKLAEAERAFYQLPLEVRAEYNHSPSQFYADFGSDHFNSLFFKPAADVAASTEKEVVTDEQKQ